MLSILCGLLFAWVPEKPRDGPERQAREAFSLDGLDFLHCVAFSPDGKALAACGTHSHDPAARDSVANVVVWDVPSGRRRFRKLLHLQDAWALAFSPDSKWLATGGGKGAVQHWDARTGIPLLLGFEGHRFCIDSIIFTKDGKTMITGGSDNLVKVWDVATGKARATFRFPFKVAAYEFTRTEISEKPHEKAPLTVDFKTPVLPYDLALSPDGKSLAMGGGEKEVLRWDPTTGKEQPPLKTNHSEGVCSVAFSPDGKLLATGGIGEDDGTVCLWDVATAKKLHTLKGHKDTVGRLVFSPDGKTLVSSGCNSDETARLWNVETGKERAFLRNRSNYDIRGVAVSPDGKMVATVGGPDSLRLWDLRTAKLLGPDPR